MVFFVCLLFLNQTNHSHLSHISGNKTHLLDSDVCMCVQVEPAGSSHCAAVYHGHYSGGDRGQRFAAHQPNHHPHHESAEDCKRYDARLVSDSPTCPIAPQMPSYQGFIHRVLALKNIVKTASSLGLPNLSSLHGRSQQGSGRGRANQMAYLADKQSTGKELSSKKWKLVMVGEGEQQEKRNAGRKNNI